MKKILPGIAIGIVAFIQTAAAQDTQDMQRLHTLLKFYYNIKDALVHDSSAVAAVNADDFIRTINGISYSIVSEGNANVLVKDAMAIATSKNISAQRNAFMHFSDNVAALAKGIKLSDEPVYLQYCPMKKAQWLSAEAAIKNPYYGKDMLHCGEVTDTLR